MAPEVHNYTNLANLSNEMDLPIGGIGIVLQNQKIPVLVLRVKGGVGFSHVPIVKAFDDGRVKLELFHQENMDETVDTFFTPKYNFTFGNTIQKDRTYLPKLGEAYFIMRVYVSIDDEWREIGTRLLSPFEDDAIEQFFKVCNKKRSVEVNLMQGYGPQFCTSRKIKLSKESLNTLKKFTKKGEKR